MKLLSRPGFVRYRAAHDVFKMSSMQWSAEAEKAPCSGADQTRTHVAFRDFDELKGLLPQQRIALFLILLKCECFAGAVLGGPLRVGDFITWL